MLAINKPLLKKDPGRTDDVYFVSGYDDDASLDAENNAIAMTPNR
jgi:hypothetical protein